MHSLGGALSRGKKFHMDKRGQTVIFWARLQAGGFTDLNRNGQSSHATLDIMEVTEMKNVGVGKKILTKSQCSHPSRKKGRLLRLTGAGTELEF